MIIELEDTSKVKELFAGWQETLIYSCLQKVMGRIYVTDSEHPVSAFAYVGCFGFFAGNPDRELVENKPEGFSILTPQNEAWAKVIEDVYPNANKVTRYAIKKDTHFDMADLRKNVDMLPKGYEIREIDSDMYDKCLEVPAARDFVSSFADKEQYLELGRGVVILKNGEIVSGASSYTRYKEGIEIEVDTVEKERRNHLATIACSALILKCLKEGLYPSWDAQNWNSVRLAEKLGYEFAHEYTAYEVGGERMRVSLHDPQLEDLWFREAFLADPDTMAYNHAWGGTISFPKEKWKSWYEIWVNPGDEKHFYRFLRNVKGEFVGEVAYHIQGEQNMCMLDVIIASKYRGNGYGKAGLLLLCEQAKANGIDCVYDNIAIDNAAVKLFEEVGFVEEYRTEAFLLLKKML